MAGIVGNATTDVLYGAANPRLSEDLDDLTEVVVPLDYYEVFGGPQNSLVWSYARMPEALRRGISGAVQNNFWDDFYQRIHVFPSRIDLGTVANAQSRDIAVWNAHTQLSANLTNIVLTNADGIELEGPALPFLFAPMQEQLWEATITPDGPPTIDARIQFDFTGVADPAAVIITGSRAAVMPSIPEPPIMEKWSWLTDVQVSVDGTEQRIGIRGVPRRRISSRLAFDTEEDLRAEYATLLGARGRLFVPYYQYSTVVTAPVAAGVSVVPFNTGEVDLRNGDYILILSEEAVILVETDVIGPNSASLKNPLPTSVPKGARIVGAYASTLPNNLSLSRLNVNQVGSMDLQSDATFPRSSHIRPGAVAVVPEFEGLPLLTQRPINDNVDHEFDTGQVTGDAKSGLVDISVDWDYTRVEQSYRWKVRRVGRVDCGWMTGVDNMDFWRAFTDRLKGSLNAFYMPSFRPDLRVTGAVGVGANSIIAATSAYVDNFFGHGPYDQLAITTDAGVHYAKVTAASRNDAGNSAITFVPALPSGLGWNAIHEVSFLLKLRISNDNVELEHQPLDTIFKINTRTVTE